MLMAAKTSDRGDDRAEANLQTVGPEERPAQGVQTVMKWKRRTVLPIIH